MYQRISGNKAAYGAGVYTQGDFVLNSGTIAKNVADRSGGGVMLDSGLFAMRDDSEIKDNVAGVEGGGIMLQEGNFMLAGGAITGNAAGKAGGGIYVGSRSVIELVERPSVINNTVGKSANNVLLEDPEQSPLRLEGLRASDGIGVSTDAGLAAEPPIVFTSGFGKGDPTKIFSSDDPAYAVGLNSQGEAFLGLPVTVSFEPGDEVTGEMPPVTTASGGIYEVPVCQYRHKNGRGFIGWQLGDAILCPSDVITVDKSLALTALWADTYPVWVGDTQVSESNKGDVLGDGTVRYDPDTATLTLNDFAGVESTTRPAISATGIDLTVTGSGSVASSRGVASHGIQVQGGSLQVGGELSIRGDQYGIYAEGDVTFTRGTVHVSADSQTGVGVCVPVSGGSVTVAQDVSMVEVSAGERAFRTGNDLSVTLEEGLYVKDPEDGSLMGAYVLIAHTDKPATAKVAAREGLVYNGSEQELVSHQVDGGTISFALSEEGPFGQTATAKDAGTYQVYYRVKGDASHDNIPVSGPIEVTIAKAVPDITVPASQVADDLDASVVKLQKEGGPDGTLTLDQTELVYGTNICHWTFAPDDTKNYEIATGTVEITVTGHDWGEPTYDWRGVVRVVATRVCKINPAHKETETADVTSRLTKEPTCTEYGEITYTAAFENPAFETQTKAYQSVKYLGHDPGEPVLEMRRNPDCTHSGLGQELYFCKRCGQKVTWHNVTFDALGHDWGETTYTWSEDNTSVTARRVCKRDGSHVESETVATTVESTKAATCARAGEVVYAAHFENPVFEDQTKSVEVPRLSHEPGEPVYENEAAPTCEKDGTRDVVTYCSVCDEELARTKETIPGGHAWGEWVVTEEPTCEGYGTMVRTCANDSSHTQSASIDPIGHEWDEGVVTTEPGCVTDGVRTFTCKHDPSHTRTEAIEKTLHETEMVEDVIVEATCDHSGYAWSKVRCMKCGEVMTRRLVRHPALGHLWGEPSYEWSADNASVTATRVCERDHAHAESETVTMTYEVTKEPTCTEGGEATYTATFENDAFQTQAKTVELDALGHDWQTVATSTGGVIHVTKTCTRCGEVVEYEYEEGHSHDMAIVGAVEPTCTENGIKQHCVCVTCQKLFEDMSGSVELQPFEVVIPAFDHDWGEPTYVWSADNGSVVATRVCKHDASHAESEAVRTTAKTTKETSCAGPGEVAYTAKFANVAFEDQTKTVEVAPLAHTPGDAVLEHEVAITCEKDGSRDVVSYCTVCHKELTRVHEVIPATGHSWSAWTVTTPATCEGRGVETRACQNDSSHMETRQIEALGHDWDEGTLTVAPTCSAEGTRVYTCRHDASHTRTETVEKLRHQTAHRTEKISAATCTQGERSWDVTYCTVCGEVIERQLMEGEPLGHDWDAPTYTWSEDNGLVTAKRVCAHDESHVELETVETTNRVIAAATCTKAGEVVYEATFENDAFASQSKTTELPALGHEWGEASYAWAEDNASVVATRSCLHDESHAETEIASCTAEVTKQPTCTEAGETTYTATFQNLAFAPQSKVVEDLEPLGHEAGPAVREQVVAATCEEAGSYELVTNCARCGEGLSRKEVTVPALGHDWGVWKTTTEATCDFAGVQTRTCKNDASHVETREVAVLGHDWGEWSVTERATCTKAGLETRVCRNDDAHVETREIAALGHDWGDWYVAKAPTCTERGIEKRTCKNDSDHGEAHFIDALGHDWVEPTYVWAEDDASVTATRACSRDETHVEAETVAVTSTVTKPATCTEDGEKTLVARFENDAFKEQSKTIVLPATGHEPATPVRENLIEATCTEAGSFESVTYCKLCGEGLLRTQEYLSPLGHSWDEGVVTLAPTCEDEGVRTYTCRNDASHTRTEALPALGHDWSPWEVTVPSSEDSEGEESRVCRHDSSHVQTRVIPALGHEHQLVKVEAIQPTCIEDGNVEYWVCDKGEHPCGRFFLDQDAQQEVSYEDVVILALGHTWDEGVVTVEPSCTVDGVRVHTCGICGATKEEPEEKTLHENEWVDETIIEPTCMARGYHWHVLRCVKCGEAMTRLLREDAPLGHDWGEPTYTWSEDDSSVTATRVCARDASHVESETVAVTTTVTREATKTEDGEKVLTATFANPVFSPQEKVVAIPATGEPDDPTPEDFSYAIVEGANSTWTRGSGEPVVMVVKRSLADETCFAHFSGVRIDGVALDDGDFEARSGSTVITFRPGYLQTLATGGHEVDILFDDGSVSTTLTVLEASSGPVDPTPEPDAEQPVTPDGGSNRSSGGSATPASSLRAVIPQTGDVMGLRHALLALASCGMLALYVGMKLRRTRD